MLFVCTHSALAQDATFWYDSSNGFRNKAKVAITQPSDVKLDLKKSLSTDERLKKILDDDFSSKQFRALIVAKNNSIIYERYGFGLNEQSTPLGFSMSKSLTALAVGKAVCDGHIQNLNNRVEQYVTKLAGTSWGNSTITDVLTMRSGAFETDLLGHRKGHRSPEAIDIYYGRVNRSYIEVVKDADLKESTPGSKFHYSNTDTLILGLVVQEATKLQFPQYFETAVWRQAKTANDGAWLVNGSNEAATYLGFSATPKDWIRLGLHVLDQLKIDDCYGNYLKQATSTKVPHTGSGPSNEYGYQIWTNCGLGADFCFVGRGGQYLLFNKKENLVLYLHATSDQTSFRFVQHYLGLFLPKEPTVEVDTSDSQNPSAELEEL